MQGYGLDPWLETKTLHVVWHSQKNKYTLKINTIHQKKKRLAVNLEALRAGKPHGQHSLERSAAPLSRAQPPGKIVGVSEPLYTACVTSQAPEASSRTRGYKQSDAWPRGLLAALFLRSKCHLVEDLSACPQRPDNFHDDPHFQWVARGDGQSRTWACRPVGPALFLLSGLCCGPGWPSVPVSVASSCVHYPWL